jgi:hypothetical protein
MSDATPPKPWPVSVFETKRVHLTNFVRTDILPLLEDRDNRRVVVRAPVKCGKREMVEYIAMRDSVEKPTRVHAFLSAWHRTADADQRDELKGQNMDVFSITTQKKVDAFLKWLFTKRLQKKTVVLHLDECDHGSGSKQMLSQVWKVTRDVTCITNILYSATPEEVLYSGEVEDAELHEMMDGFVTEGHRVEYTPPEGYCGPGRFLEAGLVHEALPFFHKEGDGFVLSEQGKQIVADLRSCMATSPQRNLVVLRLSYSELGGKQADIKKNKAIYQFLQNIGSFPELAGFSVIVDKGEGSIRYAGVRSQKIEWSSRSYWEDLTTAKPFLFVIDQTSSRSTEWACHDRIFATHDFRNVVQYSTISQAQERVNHYEQRYGGFQPIRIYGHTRTFRLSAGKIGYETFLVNPWEKKKIDVRTSPVPMYRVRSSAPGHALHPECAETGLQEIEADRLLQRLGCFADISLSARVAGRVRDVRTYMGAWFAATKDTWATAWPRFRDDPANGLVPAEGTRDGTRNPFEAAAPHLLADGTWQGQHRGWKVLDFIHGELYQRMEAGAPPKKLDLGSTGGNRVKVCYKDGVLGVFVARCTGMRQENTLRAYNSMYKDRA